MSLDWSNERYVRVYTRDTTTWKLFDWRARAVLLHLFRKVDRSGVLDVGDDGLAGLAAVLELPLEEVIEPGVAQLVKRGTVEYTGDAYVIPNFMDAQETSSSDAQRQRAAREKRRASKRARDESVTKPVDPVTKRDASVTTGHRESQAVTPSLAKPSLADLNQAEPDRPLTGAPRASARSHDTAAPAPVVVEARCAEVSQVSLLAPSEPEPAGQDRARRDRKPVKRRLPADWAPTAEHAKIASERKLDLSGEVLKLRDWAASRGAAYADWDAMFRNWLRNDQFRSRAPPRQRARPPWVPNTAGSDLPGLMADIERMEREQRERDKSKPPEDP